MCIPSRQKNNRITGKWRETFVPWRGLCMTATHKRNSF